MGLVWPTDVLDLHFVVHFVCAQEIFIIWFTRLILELELDFIANIYGRFYYVVYII